MLAKLRFTHSAKILLILTALCVVLVLISMVLGRYSMDPMQVVAMLANRLFSLNFDSVSFSQQQAALFFGVRLPRIFMALLVGASLSVAGATFQGVFQNPLVSPDFLGASQGAAFGACLAILLNWSNIATTISAFFFSMLSVVVVLALSKFSRSNRVLVTVLAGIMVSSLFSAGVSFIKLVADPNSQLQAITFWLMGSLTSAKAQDIYFIIVPISLGLVGLLAIRWRLNILTLGDVEAQSLGVKPERLRTFALLLSTLLVAASVSVSGIIGWVGLVIPHIARALVGPNYQKFMPASLLLGASFLLATDNIARLALSSEIPIGILTSFIGAPFFLHLIYKRGRL